MCISNIVDLACPPHSLWQTTSLRGLGPAHILDPSLGAQRYVLPSFTVASTDISSAGVAMLNVMRGTQHVLCARTQAYLALATRKMFSLMQGTPTVEFAFEDPH